MRITLLYNGDNAEISYPPTFPLMLGRELANVGFKVDIIRDDEDFDYDATPSDNLYKDCYLGLIEFINQFREEPLDISKLRVDFESSPDYDIAGILTSIGCKFHCKYCPQKEMGYTDRDLDIVLSELDYVTKNHKYFEFLDNNVLANTDRFLNIIKHIPPGIEWGALMNIDNVSDLVLQEMKIRGCVNIYLGLETFNEADLKYFEKPYFNKGIDPKEFIIRLRRMGFNVLTFVIRGLPNETEEDFEKMIEWLKENGVLYTIGRFHKDGQIVKETKNLTKGFLELMLEEDSEESIANLNKLIGQYI